MTSEFDRLAHSSLQQPPLRLFCDEMLMRLARWLRAAGHDTELAAQGAEDRAVLARAVADGRCLLTRDRGFLERRAAQGRVVLLPSQVLDAQARFLRERLRVDWLYAPFSRCLLCNSPLERAPPLPGGVETRRCPRCDKLYWSGSHVQRMHARLRGWQDAP